MTALHSARPTGWRAALVAVLLLADAASAFRPSHCASSFSSLSPSTSSPPSTAPSTSPSRRGVGRGAVALGAKKKQKKSIPSYLRSLENTGKKSSNIKKTKSGKLPEWTSVDGVSLPTKEGELKGWELPAGGGKTVQLTAARHGGEFFVLSPTACSRCAWELHKGSITEGLEGEPAIKCVLCGTTYRLRDGAAQEPKALGTESTEGNAVVTGWNGFVSGLARKATATNTVTSARSYPVKQEEGRIFLAFGNPRK